MKGFDFLFGMFVDLLPQGLEDLQTSVRSKAHAPSFVFLFDMEDKESSGRRRETRFPRAFARDIPMVLSSCWCGGVCQPCFGRERIRQIASGVQPFRLSFVLFPDSGPCFQS